MENVRVLYGGTVGIISSSINLWGFEHFKPFIHSNVATQQKRKTMYIIICIFLRSFFALLCSQVTNKLI